MLETFEQTRKHHRKPNVPATMFPSLPRASGSIIFIYITGEVILLIILKGKWPSTIESDELEELGYLVSGLSPEEIDLIRPTVFTEAVATLGDIDDLDNETTAALAAKAVEAYG